MIEKIIFIYRWLGNKISFCRYYLFYSTTNIVPCHINDSILESIDVKFKKKIFNNNFNKKIWHILLLELL